MHCTLPSAEPLNQRMSVPYPFIAVSPRCFEIIPPTVDPIAANGPFPLSHEMRLIGFRIIILSHPLDGILRDHAEMMYQHGPGRSDGVACSLGSPQEINILAPAKGKPLIEQSDLV